MPRDPSRFIAPDLVDSRYTEGGAEGPAEFSSCDELFLSILTPRWSGSADFRGVAAFGRLIVDTFGMQHPNRSCKSAKSCTAHLTGRCCGAEYNGAQSVYSAIQRWLNGPAEAIGIARPTEPDERGSLSIRHVFDAETKAEIAARVDTWARVFWRAYASQHEIAGKWIREALGE